MKKWDSLFKKNIIALIVALLVLALIVIVAILVCEHVEGMMVGMAMAFLFPSLFLCFISGVVLYLMLLRRNIRETVRAKEDGVSTKPVKRNWFVFGGTTIIIIPILLIVILVSLPLVVTIVRLLLSYL